jgi:hypothetical protein
MLHGFIGIFNEILELLSDQQILRQKTDTQKNRLQIPNKSGAGPEGVRRVRTRVVQEQLEQPCNTAVVPVATTEGKSLGVAVRSTCCRTPHIHIIPTVGVTTGRLRRNP